MEETPLRDRTIREQRLDTDGLHRLSLPAFVAQLQAQPEFGSNGHSGVLLMRTEQMRVVLETAREDTVIHEHTVHGPTFLYVIDGAVSINVEGETRVAERGEMLVIPRDRTRVIRAINTSSLLWVLAPDAPTEPAEKAVENITGRSVPITRSASA